MFRGIPSNYKQTSANKEQPNVEKKEEMYPVGTKVQIECTIEETSTFNKYGKYRLSFVSSDFLQIQSLCLTKDDLDQAMTRVSPVLEKIVQIFESGEDVYGVYTKVKSILKPLMQERQEARLLKAIEHLSCNDQYALIELLHKKFGF